MASRFSHGGVTIKLLVYCMSKKEKYHEFVKTLKVFGLISKCQGNYTFWFRTFKLTVITYTTVQCGRGKKPPEATIIDDCAAAMVYRKTHTFAQLSVLY